MQATILETALSQGIWAALAVFLLISMMKENEKADQRPVSYTHLTLPTKLEV